MPDGILETGGTAVTKQAQIAFIELTVSLGTNPHG